MKHNIAQMAVILVVALAAGCGLSRLEQPDLSAQINEALADLEASAAKLGEPAVVEDALLFGTTTMNGNHEIVDALKERFGCTATFFMRKGDGFIRISTNVMKDGKRAVGTPLDPHGPVITALLKGESFHGLVDILGSPYNTAYEPIRNTAGDIIGACYVGYPVKQ